MGEQAPPGENRPNLWTAYETEYLTELNKLLKSGFTIVFIGHTEADRDTKQWNPRGDKRSMLPIRNKADLTVFLHSNGISEDGKVNNSTAWFVETEQFFARSRFDHIVSNIEFTAENLEKALTDAIKKEEEITGHKAISFEEQHETYKAEELEFESLMSEIEEAGKQIQEAGLIDKVYAISEHHLGAGAFVTQCTRGQEQVMAVILGEMKDILESIEEAQ